MANREVEAVPPQRTRASRRRAKTPFSSRLEDQFGTRKWYPRRDGPRRLPAEGGASRELLTRATGLEPATSGVTGRRSNQLNYARERSLG